MALFARLYLELLKHRPLHVAASVLLLIGAQLSLLAGLILPWKLLAVIGGATLPTWLPPALAQLGAQRLELALALAIVAAFALHLLCELGLAGICRHCAEAVLRAHAKTGLFADYRLHARRICENLLRALAAATFCIAACAWLAYAYPFLLLVMLGYAVLWLGLRHWRKPPGPAATMPTPLQMRLWWQFGFIVALCGVIWSYWQQRAPPLLVAVTALLLARQVLISAIAARQQLAAVAVQRERARALFFRDATWRPAAAAPDTRFGSLLESPANRDWIGALLAGHGAHGRLREVAMRPAEAGNVAYLKTTVEAAAAGHDRFFVLKLLTRRMEAAGEHEAELLRAAQPHWPMPRFIADARVDGLTCLLLETGNDAHWLDADQRAPLLRELRTRLMACELPGALILRHDRTHPTLAQRLQAVDWGRLCALAQGREEIRAAAAHLRPHWTRIVEELSLSPRQLVLPGLGNRQIASDGARSLLLCDWSRWSWQPLGCGWPLSRKTGQELAQALRQAGTQRPALLQADPAQAGLCARLHEFERRHAAGNLAGALNMLPGLANADLRQNGLPA